MTNINAQQWLDKKYPQNGTCQRDNDPENKGKTRTQITELDISKGKVGSFFSGSKNLVGSLGLEKFTNLRKLIVSSHQLTSLDLNSCQLLTELDCQNNQLNSLNISGCSNLKKINCSNNHLKELDLTGCTQLKEVKYISNSFSQEIELSNSDVIFESDFNSKTKSANSFQMTSAEKNTIRNLLIIGITGNGKSALANALSNTSEVNKFGEGNSGVSKTKVFQKSDVFQWKGNSYCIIDNIGFGDTASLSKEDILFKIGEGICSAKEGLNQILFVISGRFAPEHIKAFNIFKEFIDEVGIARFTTIVKTHFTDFRSLKKCEEDKEALLNESKELSTIINSCNGVIHVDNPSIPLSDDSDDEREIKINSDKRKISRERMLNHLVEKCHQVYKLKEWDSIHTKVANCIKKIKENEAKLAGLDNEAEKGRLRNEIKEDKRKVAEEVNVKMEAVIGVVPQLTIGAEIKNPNCCLII